MTTEKALRIILELAEDNMLTDDDGEADLRREVQKQAKAYAKIQALLEAMEGQS